MSTQLVQLAFCDELLGTCIKYHHLIHARSAAICATFESDVDVFEYAPREIKQAVVGNGAATKDQVQHMVISILRLEGEPSADAADALAAALCHGHQRRLNSRLSGEPAIAGAR